jgi:SAM-dependent methyltransferase
MKVFHGGIEEHIGKIGKADIVIMNDVIEHFIKPLDALSAIKSILKKDGLIAIWTPNGGNAGRSIETAKRWIGFGLDLEHMQYFSNTSIIEIAGRYGWELVHLENIGYPSLEKLKNFKPSAAQRVFSDMRYKISNSLRDTAVGRAAKSVLREFIKRPENGLGTYSLFAILRNPSYEEKRGS